MAATFVMGLSSYARPSYAACVSIGAPNFLCSGANVASVGVFSGGAQISTDSTFSVNVAGATGIGIFDTAGDVSFTDIYGSIVTGTDAISIVVGNTYQTGMSNLTINVNTNATGTYRGMRIFKDGEVSITTSGDIQGNIAGIDIDAGVVSNEGITIHNTGRIAGVARGLFINYGSATTGATHIINEGLIEDHLLGTFGLGAIYINGTGGVGLITNTGDIIGRTRDAIYLTNLGADMTIDLAGGRVVGDIYDNNIGAGFSKVLVSGDFESEGNMRVSSFEVGAGGEFTLGLNNTITTLNDIDVSGDFIVSNTGGVLNTAAVEIKNGGRFIVEEDFTFSNAGARILRNDGELRILQGKTLNVDQMGASSGQLSFEVSGAGIGEAGFLNITNGALDLTNQSVFVRVTPMDTLVEGDNIHLVRGVGTIVGGPGATLTTVSDNSVLWDFQMFDGSVLGGGFGDNDLFVRAFAEIAAIGFLANTDNNKRSGEVLFNLNGNTTNPQLLSIIGQMNSASTVEEFNVVLESVLPVAHMGEQDASQMFNGKMHSIRDLRLQDIRMMRAQSQGDGTSFGYGTGEGSLVPQINDAVWAMAFGDGLQKGEEIGVDAWGELSGNFTRQQERDGVAGYYMRSGGAAVGADTGTLWKDVVVGAGLGYGYAEISSKNATRTQIDIDSYFGTLYADYTIDENLYVSGGLSYVLNNNKTTRTNVGGAGLTAEGDYSSYQFGVNTAVGYHINYDDYVFTPSIGLDYTHYTAERYRETGAGGGGLNIKTEQMERLDAGVGLRVKKPVGNVSETLKAQAELRTGYHYDVIGDRFEKTSSFIGGGAGFKTEGPDPARHRFNVGGSVELFDKGGADYRLSYDYDTKEDFDSHTIKLKASVAF